MTAHSDKRLAPDTEYYYLLSLSDAKPSLVAALCIFNVNQIVFLQHILHLLGVVSHLSHIGPEDVLGPALREDKSQGIFKSQFSWLARSKDQVARDLKFTMFRVHAVYESDLSEVWSTFVRRQFGIKSVDVLKMVVLQHTGLHGVVLFFPLGLLLQFLLKFLTLNPLTSGKVS